MKKRVIKVISQISILLLCLLGYYFLNKYYHISVPCLFKKVTNLQCPGCGITRCLFSLLEGKLHKAFYYNQLITILLLPFIIYETINIFRYIKGATKLKVPNYISNITLIIVIIFGIIRNII